MRAAGSLAVLGLAATISAYAVDYENDFSLAERDIEADYDGTFELSERDLEEDGLFAREIEELLDTLSPRELEELEARNFKSFIHKVGHVVKKVAGAVIKRDEFDSEESDFSSLSAREVDEHLDILTARSLEELEARSKIGEKIKGVFKKIGHVVKKVAGAILKRDELGLDDMDIHNLVVRELAETLTPRELEEIEARDPGIFGMAIKAAKGIGKGIAHAVKKHKGGGGGGQQQQQQQRRDLEFEFDDSYDLAVRDLLENLSPRELEELEARNPGIFGMAVKAAKGIGKGIAHAVKKHHPSAGGGGQQQQQQQRRDLEDSFYEDPELFVRSEFDFEEEW